MGSPLAPKSFPTETLGNVYCRCTVFMNSGSSTNNFAINTYVIFSQAIIRLRFPALSSSLSFNPFPSCFCMWSYKSVLSNCGHKRREATIFDLSHPTCSHLLIPGVTGEAGKRWAQQLLKGCLPPCNTSTPPIPGQSHPWPQSRLTE